MANIKISDLPLIANIPPTSGEFPIVYNNVTYKMNWSQLNNQITASGANPLNVIGTGTTGNITKWTTGGSVIGDSLITDNGSVVTITSNADIDGTLNVTETLTVDKTATSAIEIAKFKVSGTGGTNGNESFVSILPGSSNFTTQLRLNTNNTGNNFQTVSNKSGILELATTDSNSIVFKTNNSTRLTIDGVGVSTFTNNIKIPNSGTIGSVSAADAITILSGGQVGIKGTPSYDFHVFGNILAITGSNAVLRLIGTAGNAKLFDLKNDNGVFSIRDVNNGKDMYQTDPTSNGFHKWYINDVQKMILDSSGNVGIGTGTATPSKKLEVRRDDGVSNGLHGITDFNRAGGADAQLLIGYYANGSSVTESTIYSANNLPLSLAAGGSQRLTISSGGVTTLFANIGSAVDNAQLQIKSDGSATVTGLMFINAANTNSFNDLAGIASYIESGNAKGNLQFWTRNSDGNNNDRTTRLTISSNGNIGQANASPIADPFVNGAEQWMTYQIGKGGVLGAYKNNNESMFGFNTYFSAPSGANKAIISGMNGSAIRYYADRMTFNFLTSSGTAQTQTEAMRITSGGNVGISATPTASKLNVRYNAGGTDAAESVIAVNIGDNATLNSAGITVRNAGNRGNKGNAAGTALFKAEFNDATAMIIDKDGKVLVGMADAATQPTNSNFFMADAQSGPSITVGGHGGAHTAILFRHNGATTPGSIVITTNSTAYNISSDYRLKENVTPITDALSRVNQLKPSRFNFISESDRTVDGFLAHEVKNIIPEAISGEKDAVNEDGTPDYQGIDQSKIVPLLTAAIQEQQTLIDTLTARIDTLENN